MAKLKYLKYSGLWPNTKVEGLEEVMNNLNLQLENIEGKTMAGMIKAAAHIRVQTETKRPLTPVDYGNLKASWFVVTAKSIVAGRGTSGFKDNKKNGIKAATLIDDHLQMLEEGQGKVASLELGNNGKFLMFGYSANYAIFVHENMEVENWSRKGSGPKWLETHVKRNTKKMLDIITLNAKI